MDLAQKPVYKLDLAAGTSVVNLTTPLVEGDDRAQTFTLELTDKGAPANLNGYSVTAYFGRGKTAEAEADTIPVSGTVSGNVAKITLTESCYSRSCYFSMPIRLSNGATGQKRTYLIARGTVVKSVDGKIIDPDGSVPSLDDLFAQIAVMERSRQAAEEAAEEALAAATRADEAREGIQGDLAALTEEIDRETAPPIIPTAQGAGIVAISDSANRPIAGLRLYGKTTQDGVSTPDAPAPLVNVGAGGSIGVKAMGKNLLPNTVSTTVNNGITFTSNTDGTIAANGTSLADWDAYCIVGTATLVVGEKYLLTGCPSGGGFSIGLDGTAIYDWGNGVEFTAETENYTAVLIVRKNKTVSGIVFSPMIRLASDTNATFEPYKDGGSLTASTPDGLAGIPYSGGMLCDYIEYGHAVCVRHVGRYHGTVQTNPTGVSAGGLRFIDFYDIPYDASYVGGIMCDALPVVPTADAGWLSTEPCLSVADGRIRLYGVEGVTYTVNIFYAMQDPIETPIQADELAAYRAMTSQYPNTTVYNDSGAGMAVDYIADTKNYIDKKLAAIAAATL